ncbi:hypothetical protein [Streptomyces sp. NPDC086519]|uniref:hypothetical protein n=1 Tax=Streptomyces sp. NPDC086519 TaxID=3154863 RepID=UPI0034124225
MGADLRPGALVGPLDLAGVPDAKRTGSLDTPLLPLGRREFQGGDFFQQLRDGGAALLGENAKPVTYFLAGLDTGRLAQAPNLPPVESWAHQVGGRQDANVVGEQGEFGQGFAHGGARFGCGPLDRHLAACRATLLACPCAVRIVTETGKPIPEVAEEPGIHPGTSSWMPRGRPPVRPGPGDPTRPDRTLSTT